MKYDERTVELAKKLIEQGRVLNAVKYASSKVWFAEVLDGTQLYDVYLDTVGENEDSCQCHEFQQKNYCKHTVAVELYLHVKGYSFVRQSDAESVGKKTPRLADLLNSEAETFAWQTLLANDIIEPTLKLEVVLSAKRNNYKKANTWEMNLKIVSDKSYIVKNIADFLEMYQQQSNYRISKNYMIDWQLESFDKKTHTFIQFLYQLKNTYEIFYQKNVLTVPIFMVKDCLNYLVHLEHAHLLIDGAPIVYQNKAPQLTFHLEQDTSNFILNLVNKDVVVYFNEQLLFVDNCLYPITQESLLIYDKLIPIFLISKDKTIQITPDEQEGFLTYTLPLLQKIGVVKGELSDAITQEIPAVSFYVQRNGDTLLIDVHKQYSDKPFIQKNSLFEQTLARELRRLNLVNGRKTIDQQQDLYQFLTYDVPKLQKYGTVHLADDLNDRLFTDFTEWDIELFDDNGLLSISFSMDGISPEDVAQILNSMYAKEKFYEFADGRMLSLEHEQFTRVHHILEKLRQKPKLKDGKMSLTRAQVVQVAENIDGIGEDIQGLIRDLRQPENFLVELPKTLQTELKPYQKIGYQWLKMLSYHQMGGILADDMGLGKTVQSIAYLLSEFENGALEHKKALVIAPASLIFNWKHELNQFAPSLSATVVQGARKEREQILEHDSHVVITSYQSFRQDSELYKLKDWHVIILDESQLLKNPMAKIHQRLRDIRADFMFALSGTPIENKKDDFWSIYALILPGLFPSLKEFKRLSESDIARIARPFLLRRLKQDVLSELPEKVEHIIYHDLTKEQKTLYMGYLQRIQEQVKHYSAQEMTQNRFSILSGLLRLRQICCHPSLFLEQYDGGVGKLDQFLDLVDTARAGGHRLLVFSQFASMLTILADALAERGYASFQLTGKTPIKERLNLVNAFNQGEVDIFLISLKAGGVGLNLTSADTIILYDLWWNPAIEDQATSRAHRIGQKETVQVYRMIAEGTIEEKMIRLQQKKRELFDAVVTAEQADIFTRQDLTNEDIREILGLS